MSADLAFWGKRLPLPALSNAWATNIHLQHQSLCTKHLTSAQRRSGDCVCCLSSGEGRQALEEGKAFSAEAEGRHTGGNGQNHGSRALQLLSCDLGRKLSLSVSSPGRSGESYVLKLLLRELKEKACTLPLPLSFAGSLLRNATIYWALTWLLN